MEAGVVHQVGRVAFGIPHCKVCPLFLGQSVPVVATPRGYALFCDVCELGHGDITVRVRDAKELDIRLDDEASDEASEEE